MSPRILCQISAVLWVLAFSASGQTFQSVYSFPADQSNGRRIASALTIGPDGALYGTATEGGATGDGTAFKVATSGNFDLLGNFEAATTGRLPFARLLNIGDGFLYGATERNTNLSGAPAGTLYRLNPAGGATPSGGLNVVFALPGGGNGPKFPRALVSGAPNTIHVLGASPGGLWAVPLDGNPPVSSDLSSTAIGAFPYNIIRGSDGNLYGGTEGVTTGGAGTNLRGTLYRVAPNGSGLTRLHECQLDTGTGPYGAMVQATDGNFYGTMGAGGLNSRGTIFRLTPTGLTVIHNFSDISMPKGDLMQASDGFLYGTARNGGSAGLGGVFRIRPDGTGYQTLHVFSGPDGANPEGGLVQAADGHLYGTTLVGGAGANGTIYRIRLSTPPVTQNRAPVALGDVAVVSGGAVLIPVLENDFDADDDPVSVAIITPPVVGTAEVQPAGTILYTPGVGYAGSDEFSYSITDPSGKSAVANVRITSIAPPALVQPGVYNGLMYLDPQLDGSGDLPRAQFVINVNAAGTFTGVVIAQGKRAPVRGFFLEDGTAIASVKFSKKNKGLVFLGFRPDEPGSLLGIMVGSELWLGNARPLRGSSSGLSERYTVVTESNDVAPAGYGYAILRVLPNGLVGATGKLGDGSRLSWGTTLVTEADGTVALPVFSEPVRGGVCAGILVSPIPATQAFAGELRWFRPPASKPTKPYPLGFDGSATALVSTFTPAVTLDAVLDFGVDATGSLAIGAGPLATPAGGEFQILGTRTIVSQPLRALSFNRKKGTFKGAVQVGSRTVKFNGVVNQQGNIGAGQFIIGGETGAVVIEPETIQTIAAD